MSHATNTTQSLKTAGGVDRYKRSAVVRSGHWSRTHGSYSVFVQGTRRDDNLMGRDKLGSRRRSSCATVTDDEYEPDMHASM